MSNEIKQGDKVRVSKDIPMFYRRYNSYRVFEVEHQVVDIEDGIALLDSIPSKYVTTIPCKYLVKVDVKTKYNVGDRVKFKSLEELKKPNVGSIKIPVEVDLSDSYWDAYAADLAKEIVLKTVNSASDKRPSVIAEYATDVAKAVVKGLKRK